MPSIRLPMDGCGVFGNNHERVQIDFAKMCCRMTRKGMQDRYGRYRSFMTSVPVVLVGKACTQAYLVFEDSEKEHNCLEGSVPFRLQLLD